MKRIDSINLNEALTKATGKKHFNSVQEMFENAFSEKDHKFAYATVNDLQNRITIRDKQLATAANLLRKALKELDTADSEIEAFVAVLTALGY